MTRGIRAILTLWVYRREFQNSNDHPTEHFGLCGLGSSPGSATGSCLNRGELASSASMNPSQNNVDVVSDASALSFSHHDVVSRLAMSFFRHHHVAFDITMSFLKSAMSFLKSAMSFLKSAMSFLKSAMSFSTSQMLFSTSQSRFRHRKVVFDIAMLFSTSQCCFRHRNVVFDIGNVVPSETLHTNGCSNFPRCPAIFLTATIAKSAIGQLPSDVLPTHSRTFHLGGRQGALQEPGWAKLRIVRAPNGPRTALGRHPASRHPQELPGATCPPMLHLTILSIVNLSAPVSGSLQQKQSCSSRSFNSTKPP